MTPQQEAYWLASDLDDWRPSLIEHGQALERPAAVQRLDRLGWFGRIGREPGVEETVQ